MQHAPAVVWALEVERRRSLKPRRRLLISKTTNDAIRQVASFNLPLRISDRFGPLMIGSDSRK